MGPVIELDSWMFIWHISDEAEGDGQGPGNSDHGLSRLINPASEQD